MSPLTMKQISMMGHEVTAANAKKEREKRWETIDELLEAGESPERICSRLNTSAVAISRQGHKWGYDKAYLFDRAVRQQKKETSR